MSKTVVIVGGGFAGVECAKRLERLLRQQLDNGFSDLRGAEAAITLPVSERLLNELVAGALPGLLRARTGRE